MLIFNHYIVLLDLKVVFKDIVTGILKMHQIEFRKCELLVRSKQKQS